jgi:putative ABC transport system substrate-binding protein
VRIGFLRISAPPRSYVDALEQGFRERGYEPGRDVIIDHAFGDGSEGDLERLARELVARKVVMIVAAGNQAILAARNAAPTLPIVMAAANEPIAAGFVASLGRPGGNVTGTTLLSTTLMGKRLEILKEILPRLARVAVLMNKDNLVHPVALKETRAVAKALGVEILPFEIQGLDSFDRTFAAMSVAGADAMVQLEDAMFVTERARIAALAMQARLPAVYGQRTSVDEGGLMAYGPRIEEGYRNAGKYVDKILKGAKVGDLPVEQPTKFELVVNLKTAKALGITIPQRILLRADEVIQ